mmetsp:Transcript_45124/g.127128  ORF Transcript_45124/g.127128 Transcript_45124/m.127128 type:complete len:555 (+) Transcript_45124:1-1665(+)
MGGMPPGVMLGMPRIVMGGAPIIVVRGHFGHDPWEDLHQNAQRVVTQFAKGPNGGAVALPGGGDRQLAMMPPMASQLANVFDMFADQHAGHFGRSEGSFEVDDDHETRLRISANLPGYKLGKGDEPHPASESPLAVQVVGHRSLIVRGVQQHGPLTRTWQRTFTLPRGVDLDHIDITYSSASGNLTVDIPRNSSADAEPEKEDRDELDDLEAAGLPPAVRAMMQGLPAILNQLASAEDASRRSGFLLPRPGMDPFAMAMGGLGQMHPRFQAPEGGDRPVPEDAEVNLIGCFDESQLEKVDLKYYGEGNGASFNAMYWHANADHVPYFAMARHSHPLGHAFTTHGFVHEDEKPKWGVYDGCGSRCEDDSSRWCGCSNEEQRGFPNRECAEGEKRFAVYKILNMSSAPLLRGAAQGVAAATAAATTATPDEAKEPGADGAAAEGRPYWQLNDAKDGSEPSIDIVLPKGIVAKVIGRQVLLYTVEAGGAGESAALAASANIAPDAAPMAKLKLPVDISEDACVVDEQRAARDGSHMLKCKIEQTSVRRLPIKVIDEL